MCNSKSFDKKGFGSSVKTSNFTDILLVLLNVWVTSKKWININKTNGKSIKLNSEHSKVFQTELPNQRSFNGYLI